MSRVRCLEHGHKTEDLNPMNAIYQAIEEAMGIEADAAEPFDPERFEQSLIELGFMIVPIEDPTNLRFGRDE